MPKRDLLPLNNLLTGLYKNRRATRLVGRDHNIDSGYFDIHRFYGNTALNISDIKITYKPVSFNFKDELIAQYSFEIEKSLRQEGRIYDGLLVTKLAAQSMTEENKTIEIQSATYGQFAGSCFALDRTNSLFEKYGGTLRSYEIARGTLGQQAVELNRLAICFGVSAMILLKDKGENYLLRTRRSKKLATLTGSIGGTVAGVVDYNKGLNNLEQLTEIALRQELSEEVNLVESEYRIIPLAYTREVMRGEHPQLFCLVVTEIQKDEMTSKLEAIDINKREFDWYDFLKLESDKTITSEQIDKFNYEGRMNYYLMEEYLDLKSNPL